MRSYAKLTKTEIADDYSHLHVDVLLTDCDIFSIIAA